MVARPVKADRYNNLKRLYAHPTHEDDERLFANEKLYWFVFTSLGGQSAAD